MSATRKDWGESNDEKQSARQQLIVDAYTKWADRKQFPKNRQYWTLGGRMYDDTGSFLPGCEYDHIVVNGGLVRPEQFHTVELNPVIDAGNRKVLPSSTHLHHGDIAKVLDSTLAKGHLNAEFVHLDTMHKVRKGIKLLCKVMDPLNYVDGPTFLVWTFIFRYRKYNYQTSWAEVQAALRKSNDFQAQLQHGWVQMCDGAQPVVHVYGERTPTMMGYVSFIRKERALCVPWV
jgi:hypothetical protein